MTSKERSLAVALAGLLVLSSLAAAGTVSSATADAAANDSLAVAVENAGNAGATVSVTRGDSAVANASVTVETVEWENASYAGTGEYTTGEDGTVSLPEPAESVTVEVAATKGNVTDSTTTTISAVESDDEKTFGDPVSSFVHEVLSASDDDGPLGQLISEYVTSHNPGQADEKRPDHAGKPDDAGSRGPPDHAGSQNSTDAEGSHGPPEHAGKSFRLVGSR